MAEEAPFPPMSPPNVGELTDEQVDKQNALKQAGVELLEDGKLEEALAKFSDAIAVGCASALLYSRRAAVLMQLGRPRAVVNDCTAALLVNPDSAKAYKMRARANAKLEKWEESHLDFQTGLKIDHDDQTEEESKVVEGKAKEIRDNAVKERVQKEKDDYDTKLAADKAAYEAAVKARDAIWTDAKEEKYQETCRKAEAEKKRREDKAAAAKETAETKAAAAKQAAEKEADEKEVAEKRIRGEGGSPLVSSDASAPAETAEEGAPPVAAEPVGDAASAPEAAA